MHLAGTKRRNNARTDSRRTWTTFHFHCPSRNRSDPGWTSTWRCTRTAFPEESVRLLTTAAAYSLLHNLFANYSLRCTWIYTVQLGIDNWIDRCCYLHRRKLALIVQSNRVSVTIASSYFEKVLVYDCFPRPIFSSGGLLLPYEQYFLFCTPFEIFAGT